MPHAVVLDDYRAALVFLLTAGVIAPLFRRLKISPVIGYLVAGMALGPFGLGRFAWTAAFSLPDQDSIARLAEMGVVFLLFTIGLELSLERLKRMRRLVFGLGTLQVVVCAAAIGGIAMAFGTNANAAAIIGGALALSSTAIVIPVLAERKKLNSAAGRATFSVLLFQDLMIAPLLFMVAALSGKTELTFGFGLLGALVPPVLGIAAIVVAGRLVLRPLFQMVAAARSTEFFVAACLLVVIVTGLASAMVGLGMELGAFIAGLLLAETEYRREVEVTIEPFKGLLLGLFFVSTGAGLDLMQIAAEPLVTLGVAVGLVVLKAIITSLLGRLIGLPGAVARPVALMIGPGGEFAFVMLTAAAATQVVPPPLAAHLMIAVTLSMLAIPALASLSGRLPRPAPEALEKLAEFMPPPDDTERVIVVGFGRVGQLVGSMLERHEIPYLAVDDDPQLVRRERENGRAIYFGDASRIDFLRRVGLGRARALVVTMDAPRVADLVVAAAHTERPDLTIVARARDTRHAQHLYELGATDAVPETVEASLQLSEAVLVDIGIPMGFVIASIHEKRDEYRKILQAPNPSGRERRGIRMSTRMRDLARKESARKETKREGPRDTGPQQQPNRGA